MGRLARFGLASSLFAVGMSLSACGSPRHVVAAVEKPAPRPAPTTISTIPTTTLPRTPEPAATTVAALRSAAPASSRPGGPTSGVVPASWYGYRSVLPVIATARGWLEVRRAQRPNQSTAWIPASDAALSKTPYFLVLNLTTMHLQVFLHGEPTASYPAGVGTTTDPTVPGHYFVTMKVPPPDPGYGPFVLVTSAHSDAITDWEESGDAIIAIHGPITSYDDQLIGTSGARISHGCVRLHDSDLARLAGVPAGTPLDIVD